MSQCQGTRQTMRDTDKVCGVQEPSSHVSNPGVRQFRDERTRSDLCDSQPCRRRTIRTGGLRAKAVPTPSSTLAPMNSARVWVRPPTIAPANMNSAPTYCRGQLIALEVKIVTYEGNLSTVSVHHPSDNECRRDFGPNVCELPSETRHSQIIGGCDETELNTGWVIKVLLPSRQTL